MSRPRRRGLASTLIVLLALALVAACGREPVAPDDLGLPGDRQTGRGGAGGDGGGDILLGTWRTVIVIGSGGDIVRTTTTWRFDADGTCHFTRESLSAVEGIPRIVELPCVWSTANGRVQVTFDPGGSDEFPYERPAGDPNRLVLDDIEYLRVDVDEPGGE